jgi:hypothetical protein
MNAGRANIPPKDPASPTSANDGNFVRNLPATGRLACEQHDGHLGVEELRFRGTEQTETEAKSKASTSETWRLHRAIQTMLRPEVNDRGVRERGPAICGCGYAASPEDHVTLHVRKLGARTKAFATGIYRCQSPWLCPVCSARAAAVRRARVHRAVDATIARGGSVATVVLSVRHGRGQSLAELKTVVSDASRAARAGRAWKKIKADINCVGVLSAPEVTYSEAHGWHYHQHLFLLMLTADVAAARAGCSALVGRYLSELAARGYIAAFEQQHVTIARDVRSAASYVAKGTHSKSSVETESRASLVPFEIAERAAGGDQKMRSLWMEYARTMPGTRSCVITAGIAKALDLGQDDAGDEKELDDLPEHGEAEEVGKLEAPTWNRLLRDGFVPGIFERLEDGVRWPSLMTWVETVSPTPILRPEDVPVDGCEPVSRFQNAIRGAPRSAQELADEIARQAATTVHAQQFIKSKIDTLERDWRRYGGQKPPSIDDVARSLLPGSTSEPHSIEGEPAAIVRPAETEPHQKSSGHTIPESLTLLTATLLVLAVLVFEYVRVMPVRRVLTAVETAAAVGLFSSTVLFALGIGMIVDWRRDRRGRRQLCAETAGGL